MDIYNTELSTAYDIKKQKDQFQSFAASSESVKCLFKQQTLKQPKLAIKDEMLHKWFTAVSSKRKPVTGSMRIDKARSFDVKIKIDKCIFSEGWLQNFKEPAAKGNTKMEYCSD